jgi:hypothetical protein
LVPPPRDADALIHDHGALAYHEARRRERDVVLPDGTTHAGRTPTQWRRVALIVARQTGYTVGLDTATRMLMDRGREKDAGEVSDDDEIRRLTGR